MAREVIEAPIPGKILSVNVREGNAIKEGEIVCVIESMKMENPILSPVTGSVVEVKISPGNLVRGGDIIAIVEY